MSEKKYQPLEIDGDRLIKAGDVFDIDDILIPEGVVTVCEDAAFGNHSCGITLPQSLKRIESRAFANIMLLGEVHIPAGVEYIAPDAFCWDFTPKSLSFTVDENNPYYFAEDGILHDRRASASGPYDETDSLPFMSLQEGEIAVWDVVTFGRYPQSEKGDDMSPVEWLVLCSVNDRVLLVSRYALDSLPYDGDLHTWESCSLNKWLNGSFTEASFTDEERDLIYGPVRDDYTGHDEKVFLLSDREADMLFRNQRNGVPDFLEGEYVHDMNALLQCVATPYAVSRGAETCTDTENCPGKACADWWLSDFNLRHSSTQAYFISSEGELDNVSPYVKGKGVRPSLWVRLPGKSK